MVRLEVDLGIRTADDREDLRLGHRNDVDDGLACLDHRAGSVGSPIDRTEETVS